MNMQFLLDATNGKIFKIMADVTSGLLSKRMDIIVKQGKSTQFLSSTRAAAELQSVFDILLAGGGTGKF